MLGLIKYCKREECELVNTLTRLEVVHMIVVRVNAVAELVVAAVTDAVVSVGEIVKLVVVMPLMR